MEVTLSGRATRTSLVILGCVGLLAVVAAIAYNVVPRKNEMHASWAVRYTATSQLLADSNVVVAGHFTAVLSQGAAPSTGIPFTNFTFAVDKVFHDPGSRVTSLNGLLVIHQTGALSGPCSKWVTVRCCSCASISPANSPLSADHKGVTSYQVQAWYPRSIRRRSHSWARRQIWRPPSALGRAV
jgi:hypothetical protein